MPGDFAFILFTLVSILAGVLFLFWIFARVKSEISLRKRAKRDYQMARGTYHLSQLSRLLKLLNETIEREEQAARRIENELKALESQRSSELRAALSLYLVRERLREIPGIGPEMQQRIIRYCFKKDIQDLRFAYRINGIGPQRMHAIEQWIDRMEREFPRLLEGDFPGKEEILQKYAKRLELKQQEAERRRQSLLENKALYQKANTVAKELGKVLPSHFRAALRHPSGENRIPTRYLLGIYAPWEPIPEWFQALCARYGERP